MRPTPYVEPLAVGDMLSEMPLYLNENEYLPLPLEASYMADYAGVPRFYRHILEQP